MKLAAVVAALVAAGVAVYFLFVRAPRPTYKPHHAKLIERKAHNNVLGKGGEGMQAMFDTPDAATPCETAYNALLREGEAARAAGTTPMFHDIAPRDTFLLLCTALPEDIQPCMVPKYATVHREYCEAHRPPPGALQGMFQVKPTTDPKEQANLKELFGE